MPNVKESALEFYGMWVLGGRMGDGEMGRVGEWGWRFCVKFDACYFNESYLRRKPLNENTIEYENS